MKKFFKTKKVISHFLIIFFIITIRISNLKSLSTPITGAENTNLNQVSQLPKSVNNINDKTKDQKQEETISKDVKTEINIDTKIKNKQTNKTETSTKDMKTDEETKILKYGDSIRLRFTKITNTTLHTQKTNYVHPKTSGNQIVSGFFDTNNYKNYIQGEYDDEWVVIGPYPLNQDYKKGSPVIDGDVVRLINPKTAKKLHYFYNEKNKAPGSKSLLEVCGFAMSSPSNNWKIEITENTNERKEIIYNKTIFKVQALNELNKKYLTISNAKFSVANKKHRIVGLTESPNNNWFIESPEKAPQATPKIEIEKKEEEKQEKVEKKEAKATKVLNTMWAINSFDKALFRNNITESNKIGDSWSYIAPDGIDVKIINNIAAGAQDSIWIIDNLNQLYFQKRKNTPWLKINNNPAENSSQFIDIATSTNMPKGKSINVWAIGADRKLYRRENISLANLQGNNWTKIEFIGKSKNEFAEQISLSPEGNLSVLTNMGNLYLLKFNTNSWVNATSLGLNISEKTMQVKLGPNNTAWLLNNNQKIYFIENIFQQESGWQEITDGYVHEIAVSPNGSVFGINSNGTLYQRANTQTIASGAGWIKIVDNALKIAVSSNDTPICLYGGKFSFYKTANGQFSKFTGSTISFLNSSNEWEEIELDGIQPIGMQEITINSIGQLFALDRFYNSYYREEITEKNPMGNKWVKIPSNIPLTIELGEDETSSILFSTDIINRPKQIKEKITNINQQGLNRQIELKKETIQFEASLGLQCSLSFLNGKYVTHFFDGTNNEWIPDKEQMELKQIAIQMSQDRHILWGIDSQQNVFIKTNITLNNKQGDNWKSIPEKKMRQIFVSPNGIIWGLSNEEHYKYKQNFWLYYRTGISENYPFGSSWKPLNSAIQKLPNTAPRFLRYGDKISLSVALNRLLPKTKAGDFLDTKNLLAFANGSTAKESQIIEVVNPLNMNDQSFIKYNDPVIFKTTENKFLGIVADLFIYTKATNQNAAQFSFTKISKSVSNNLIEYGTRVKIETNKKFLVNDQSLLNSNLILKPNTNTNNGLFLILKPINNEIAVDQSIIDTVETSMTILLQELNQVFTKVLSKTIQPEAQAKNCFAQILVTLFNNQKNIPSTILKNILEISMSEQKEQLLNQNQKNYISNNMLTQLKENSNLKFQPLLTTILTKFSNLLAKTSLPSNAIISLISQMFENNRFMNKNEINALIILLKNLYNKGSFITSENKNNIKNMIKALGEPEVNINFKSTNFKSQESQQSQKPQQTGQNNMVNKPKENIGMLQNNPLNNPKKSNITEAKRGKLLRRNLQKRTGNIVS